MIDSSDDWARGWSTTYLDTSYYIKGDIKFKADFVKLRKDQNRLLCSLDGEFLKSDKPFEPPLRYEMENVGVTTRDIHTILIGIYHFLISGNNLPPEYDPLDLDLSPLPSTEKIDDDLF